MVDPRRTETARAAGEHVFLRLDTDVFFYLSFLRELIAAGGLDEVRLRRFTRGFDEVRALCEPCAADGPDRLESVSGMAHCTGVLVDARHAEPPDSGSWSGLPEPSPAPTR